MMMQWSWAVNCQKQRQQMSQTLQLQHMLSLPPAHQHISQLHEHDRQNGYMKYIHARIFCPSACWQKCLDKADWTQRAKCLGKLYSLSRKQIRRNKMDQAPILSEKKSATTYTGHSLFICKKPRLKEFYSVAKQHFLNEPSFQPGFSECNLSC